MCLYDTALTPTLSKTEEYIIILLKPTRAHNHNDKLVCTGAAAAVKATLTYLGSDSLLDLGLQVLHILKCLGLGAVLKIGDLKCPAAPCLHQAHC